MKAMLDEQDGAEFYNEILAEIPVVELDHFRRHLTHVRLVNGQSLHEPGQPIDQVYFVEHGLVSVMALTVGREDRIEVGLIGHESMTGLPVLLSEDATTFNSVIVQVAGDAWRLSKTVLLEILPDCPVLRRKLGQAFEIFIAQISQTAACNSQHVMTQRLARWLLMARERVDHDDLPIKQEFLAIMLGVSRPAVTIAMSSLESKGLIQQSRGHVVVADQPALEQAACSCFARVREFTQLVERRPQITAFVHSDRREASSSSKVPHRVLTGYSMGNLSK